MENKDLVVVKDNFFTKIKNVFKNLFGRKTKDNKNGDVKRVAYARK